MTVEPTANPPSPLGYPAFRAYLVARIGSTLSQNLIVIVLGWQVYDIARLTMPIREAAFLLGMIGLAQFIPIFLLSLVVGVVADRFDRRHIARAAIFLELLCAAALAGLTLSGSHQLWPLFAAAALLGVARAFANPSLSALAPNLVPPAVLPGAIAWSSMGFQIGSIIGPVAGGIAYDIWAPSSYLMATGLLAVSVITLFLIPPVPRPPVSRLSPLESLKQGLGFVRRSQVLFGAITLDMVAVILAGVNAILPIYARDILEVGAEGLGLLRGAPAFGAVIVAFTLTRWPLRNKVGMKMFVNVGLFCVATIVFGFSHILWLSLVALVILGGADMISVYVRQSLIQLYTPDAMRGRVSSVSSLFISASNELGEFRAGVIASLIGAVGATVVGGVLSLGITIAWARLFPELRDADRFEIPDYLKEK